VHVLVRDISKIKLRSPRIKVFEGRPSDPIALDNAMNGTEAVLTALNISRYTDFPWAKLRSPKDLLSKVMSYIIALCPKHNVKRVITVSAWGAAESRKEIPVWFRWFIEHSNIKYPYLDHAEQEKLLTESDLDWTIVRPAGLTNSNKEKKIKVSFNSSPKPGLLISRKNVARFMLDSLEQNSYIRQLPTISQ
jgi:putative NADH-flavin reductase